MDAARIQREQQQGLGKPIVSAEVKGHRFVAVKNRLMHSKGWRTFHDFLIDYLRPRSEANGASPKLRNQKKPDTRLSSGTKGFVNITKGS